MADGSVEFLGKFEVGQDSAELLGRFEAQATAELLGRFEAQATAELLGKGVVRNIGSAELLGKAVIRHVGTPVELLGKVAITHSIDLLCQFRTSIPNEWIVQGVSVEAYIALTIVV